MAAQKQRSHNSVRSSSKATRLDSVVALDEELSEEGRVDRAKRGNRRLFTVAIWLLIAAIAFSGSLLMYLSRNSGVAKTAAQQELESAKSYLAASPKDSSAWSRYALAQAANGDVDGSVKTIDDGVEKTNDKMLLLTKGDILREARRYPEAISAYSRAEKYYRAEYAKATEDRGATASDPSQDEFLAQLCYGRGLCELAIDDKIAAKKDLEASVNYFPRSATTWTALGDMYVLQSNDASATAAYENALRYVPDYADAKKGLARLKSEGSGGGNGDR